MDQQQSQKSGKRSDAQKLDRARQGFSAQPASQPVGGAFGKEEDEETAGMTEDRPTLFGGVGVGCHWLATPYRCAARSRGRLRARRLTRKTHM